MDLLPILTWEDVWNDIGKRFPKTAGTAYLAVGGRRDWLARAALRYARLRRSDRWARRHRTCKFLFLIEDRKTAHPLVIANEERSQQICAELRDEFQSDPRVLRVIELLMEGLTQTAIADQMGVSRQAVQKQLTKIRAAKCLRNYSES